MKYLIILALAIAGIIWLVNYFVSENYKRPWWDGEGQVRLCAIPYQDDSECGVATAIAEKGKITRVYVSNQLFNVYGSECFKAAEGLYTFDKFCQVTYNGSKFDVLPL